MSNSLWPHRLQHARLPYPSLSPWVCSNLHPLSQTCHPFIASSVAPLSSCLYLFQHQVLFQWVSSLHQVAKLLQLQNQLLSINIQDGFPLGLAGWISLQSKGLSKVFSRTAVQKHQFFSAQPYLWSNSHIHTWLLEKPQLWLYRLLSARWCFCFLICCLGVS